MFSAIYIEEEVYTHPRVTEILQRFPAVPQIKCGRYGEVFNRNAQNFRLQKKFPALILANKYGNLILPAPAGYGFESGKGFYFSHMLNCIYDCRYCFLQGMYRSANYVLFVNYEDFSFEIEKTVSRALEPTIYYSGYDCDSLALDPISKFCDHFLPVFKKNLDATLELRTKSTQIRGILSHESFVNCVIAMSFTAHETSKQYEHKVPPIYKRIEALQKLQQAGWSIAIRFEPIIWHPKLIDNYRIIFDKVFGSLNVHEIHTVSMGEFRMPVGYYKNIVKLYPDVDLYARSTKSVDGIVTLMNEEDRSLERLEQLLLNYINSEQYYRCAEN